MKTNDSATVFSKPSNRHFALLVLVVLLCGCSGGAHSGNGTGGMGGGSSNNAAPAITAQPSNVSTEEQKSVQFQVQAAGSGTLSYQWLRNGVAIVGATQASFSINAAQLSDNGAQFTVVVSNSVGSVTSSGATLTVQPAPLSIALQNSSVAPLGEFIITGTSSLPVSNTGVVSLSENYSLEYTLGPGAVVTVPALIEADGSIHGVSPPGALSGGQLLGGNVNVRVKRIVQTSPSATPAADYSNSVTLNVIPPLQLPSQPGYATQLLVIVGKYLAADAASHNNVLVDSTTSQLLSSFDFDGLANNVVATTDPIVLSQTDSFAAATLLTAYHYDLASGSFVPSNSSANASAKSQMTRPIRKTRMSPEDESDPTFQALAQSIANNARSIGSTMANAGKTLGICAGIALLSVDSPLIVPVAVAGALMTYVGTASGTALGFAFDLAATEAANSSSPEAAYKTALPTINFFASNTISSISDTLFSPIDGLADEYLQKNLPAEVYSAYQIGGAFLLADSGPLSERLVNYAETVASSDPSTPPIDKATLNADIQATSSTAVADAIDSNSANVPSMSSTGADLTTLSNQLLTLANVLQTLSSAPGNQYTGAIQTFSSCSTPYDNDIIAIADQVVASGGNVSDQDIAQLKTDVQGIVTCGSALTQTLASSANTAASTQTGMSGADQITESASNCDSNGCWITELTTHSDGSSSKETGYVPCKGDGFCPLYLH